MLAGNSGLAGLAEADRRAVEEWLVQFDECWEDGLLGRCVTALPPPPDPRRLPTLVELVRIDLERQWERGRPVRVEEYLEAYPELGTANTVSADLLLEEVAVRARFGSADLDEFARRFPKQAARLRQLVARALAAGSDSRFFSPADTVSHPGSAPSTGPDAARRPLPEQFGRYRILRPLGRGGMGAVYLAEDTLLQRRVALKVPHFTAADGPDAVERFYREARAAAALKHPNFCRVHDVGAIDGVHYLTMEYLEGRALSELLRGGLPWPAREAGAFVRRVALALAAAHEQGVIHRDLKPSNIMVARDGAPVIMDFGLARRAHDDARLTTAGLPLGTPAYMPPEQVRGDTESMGPACDVYSLGAVLYELLTGRPPFDGPVLAVLGQILTRAPEPPSAHRPDLAGGVLERVCLKALAREPADRYHSMHDFAAALAVGQAAGSSAAKTRRRWPLVAGGVAVLLLAGVLLLPFLRPGGGAGRVEAKAPEPPVAAQASDPEPEPAPLPDEEWQVLARLISPTLPHGRIDRDFRAAACRLPYVYAVNAKDFWSSDLVVFKLPEDVVGTVEVKEVCRIDDAGDGGDLRVVGDTLLLTSRGGLEVFSLADPAKPQRLERVGPTPTRASRVLIAHGQRAFLVGETDHFNEAHLSMFDLSTPAKPRHLGTLMLPHQLWSGCAVGNYLYLGSVVGPSEREGNGVFVYELGGARGPREVGFVPTDSAPFNLFPTAAGKKMMAVMTATKQLFSLADPRKPSPLAPATPLDGWMTGGRSGALVSAPAGDRLVCCHEVFAVAGKGFRRVHAYHGGHVPSAIPHHGGGSKDLVAVPTHDAVFVLRFTPKGG
jgi:hypothetical protein